MFYTIAQPLFVMCAIAFKCMPAFIFIFYQRSHDCSHRLIHVNSQMAFFPCCQALDKIKP